MTYSLCLFDPATTEIYTLSLHDALPISLSLLYEEAFTGLPRAASTMRLYGRNSHLMRKRIDRKSTRLNSSHLGISYAVFCLKKKKELSVLNIVHTVCISLVDMTIW